MQKNKHLPPLVSLLWNFVLVYLLYMLCRVVYVWEFRDLYAEGWHQLSICQLLAGSLRFDTSAILYTNLLYALMELLPLPRRWTEAKGYRTAVKSLFVAVNTLMISINLADTVYSRYTGRRTTWTFFSEFSNEGNLGSIFGIEVLHHWYLVLLGLAMLAALLFLYRPASPYRNTARHYLGRSLGLVLFIPLAVIGMRGGASTSTRPITISNANQYVDRPSQAAIVLNTPFSMIRTMGKTAFTDPRYFTPDQLDSLYSPLHTGSQGSISTPNVVVLILESFAQEYIGAYNHYEGYTPFLDSLIGQSLTFSQSFANGRKSIDAMPSILSGIPMFVEPFILTPYSLNNISSIAGELRKDGYCTAFFHGADNGSMGFEAYARTAGFEWYYGRTEYNADPHGGGDADFDGTWAVWDEEFLQYFTRVLDTLPQPFCTALFTASSHHPFRIPARYADSLRTAGHPMYTCIRYTDMALRRFFASASRQPWFRNTLFVITADHTNHSERPSYQDALGPYRVPIIFFDPSGRLPRGRSNAIAQQTDIMPTVLSAVGHPTPYIAFGIDLLGTPTDSTWALHYNNGIYQYVSRGHLLTFDGEQPTGLYRMATDPFQHHNLLADPNARPSTLDTRHPKAIIQSYMQRMITDSLTVQ